jgi:hypothetical protein
MSLILPKLKTTNAIDEVEVSSIGMLKVHKISRANHGVSINIGIVYSAFHMSGLVIIHDILGMIKIEFNGPLPFLIKKIANAVNILRNGNLRQYVFHVHMVMSFGILYGEIIAIALKGAGEFDIGAAEPALGIAPISI